MTRLTEHNFAAENLATPPCPYFDECGACQVQHLKPDFYRGWKESEIKRVMAENKVVPAEWLPSVFIEAGTRRRVAISALREGDDLILGFHRYHENTIAPVKECLLLTPTLDKIYRRLPDVLTQLLPRNVQVDVLLQEADGHAVDCVISGLTEREEKLGAKQTNLVARLADHCEIRRVSFKLADHSQPIPQIELDRITKTSGALKVEISPGAFLQPSNEGEVALSDAVMKALGKLGKKDKVLDLFSGCGTFAGRILEKCNVHAIENDFGMANSLKDAARGHARFTAEARDLFKEPVSVREMKDKATCERRYYIAVSCNPLTFARDAKILMDGGYKLKSLQIFDQFIYTTHTELVGVFVK